MDLIRRHILFVLLFSLCVVLRFVPLLEYQFTYDELSGLERTRFDGFGELMEKGVKIDAHPALVQVIIFYLTKCFGYANWIIKLPFLLISLASVILGYMLGLRHFSKNCGLLFSALLAYGLVFVFHAPIARMYGIGVFFSLGLLYFFMNIFFQEDSDWKNYVMLSVFAALGAYNHHMNSLFAFSVYVSGLVMIGKADLKKLLLSAGLALLLYSPHIPITLYQLGIGGIGVEQGGWLEVPSIVEIFNFVKIVLGTGYLWLVLVVFAVAGFLFDRQRTFYRMQLWLLLLFLSNFLVIFVYSLYRAPVYQHTVMLFSGVCIPLLVSSFIMPYRHRLFYPIFTFIFLALISQTYIRKDYLNECVHTVYEYQFSRTSELSKVTAVFFDADENMKEIYFERYPAFECRISSDSIVSNGQRVFFDMPGRGQVSSLALFAEHLEGSKSDYLALSSAMPVHMAIAREYFPYLIEKKETQAIHYRLYSRVKSDSSSTLEEVERIPSNEFLTEQTGKIPQQVDSAFEFPYTRRYGYEKLSLKEGNVILTKAIIAKKKDQRIVESCITVNAKSGEPYIYSGRDTRDFVLKKDSTMILYGDCFIGRVHNRIKAPSVLSSYIWNSKGSRFTLKDYDIRVVDYWPKKWNFWD